MAYTSKEDAMTFEYKNKMLRIDQILDLKECNYSISHLSKMLKLGKGVEAILNEPKRCRSCRIMKEISEFNVQKAKKDGKDSRCRKCSNAYSTKYDSDHKKERKIYRDKIKKDAVKTASEKKIQDKQIIKQSKADIKRQRAIKIMSKPINPKYTQIYYMSIHKPRSESNMDQPIQLTKGRGY